MRNALVTVVPMTAIQVGTILTPLMAAKDLSTCGSVFFAFLNDGAAPVTIRVDTSEDGSLFDADQVYLLTVAPGTQRSLIFDSPRTFFRASGTSLSGTNQIRFAVRGKQRIVGFRPGRS